MRLIQRTHGHLVHPRRVNVLTQYLTTCVPSSASVLDIGCGDGLLSSLLGELLPSVKVQGIDVLVRDSTHIPVESFDGKNVPYPDRSFDATLLIDVLHHSEDPLQLLAEAARVSRSVVVIKDHLSDARLASTRLRLMDWIGNRSHGVALPYEYWALERWMDAFKRLKLRPRLWITELHLYPWFVDWLFGRSLHFMTCLEPSKDLSNAP